MKAFLILPAMLMILSCKGKSEQPVSTKTGSATAITAAPNPCDKATADHGSVMRWHVDDYDAALSCAKASNKSLVIDLWAPWCHTCLSMKTTVFTDKTMLAIADKFVFVGIDTDRDVNAAVVAKYPLSAWPTFYVVSPSEVVQARLVGSASAAQFVAFAQQSQTVPAVNSHEALAQQGHQAVTKGDFAAALPLFTQALQASPKDWPRRPELVLALLQTHSKLKDPGACVALALAEAGNLGKASSAGDAVGVAMGCAEDLDEKSSKAQVTAVRAMAIANWQTLVDDPTAELSVDDRSDTMANLREALDADGKKDQAKAIAEKQLALLDGAAAAATTPLAAMTYNWPRSEVYVYLQRPLDVIDSLKASAQALPQEYDPPYRIAWVYHKAQRYPDAALWAAKAKALVYGPRKARVLSLIIDLAKAQADIAGELSARQELVELYKSLPAPAQNADALAKAQADLAAMQAATPSAAK
jgi:thioredoxin-like negative regulator of GroEL